ncbi:MAG: hypothetical protein CMH53_00680, partial [Myxococcales bacterium]|nr:hypothetical protein [Myxococcales bacterium]
MSRDLAEPPSNPSSATDSKRPKTWWLRSAFALLSLALVASMVDVSELWQRVRSIPGSLLVVALGLNGLRQILLARRWQMMNSADASHSFGEYLLFTLASRPATLLLPGGLGFDIARMVLIGRGQQGDSGEHRISVISDRFLGLASVIVLGLLSVALAPVFASRLTYGLLMMGLFAAFAAGVFLATSARVQKTLISRFCSMGRWGKALVDGLALWSRVVDFFRA